MGKESIQQAKEHAEDTENGMISAWRGARLAVSMWCTVAATASAQDHAGASRATPPSWAYPVNPPPAPAITDDTTPLKVPGASVTFRRSQTTDRFFVPAWRPAEHPAMPLAVAHGRRPDGFACGDRHLPNGVGR